MNDRLRFGAVAKPRILYYPEPESFANGGKNAVVNRCPDR